MSADLSALEAAVQACAELVEKEKRLESESCIKSLREIRKIFDGLGSVFSMAFQDMDEKIGQLETGASTEEFRQDLLKLIDQDKATMKDPTDTPADNPKGISNTRAVNRCCHILDFVSQILCILAADPKKEVGPALADAYVPTLQRIHTFVVKSAVKVAFKATPYRTNFVKQIGSTEEELVDRGPRIQKGCSVITAFVEAKFKELEIPWVF
eukprot:gnl/MRDRNA2_/MRDRNA2_27975_c0_seq1.p1 gnl/MRDRNA2_/MRDRNA2_27975_c0~~gnl/MRDRNA2_/MRDRNA2_27975_c0_seq1.p1  ORF type:complete len:238 (-),score=49.70 gnl/MRDRNA2_/MRDRNA2_27975_c0_seq1:392-1024(-)